VVLDRVRVCVGARIKGSSCQHTPPLPTSTHPHPHPTQTQYTDELELPAVMALIDKDLSEPYSIFTYRYFLAQVGVGRS